MSIRFISHPSTQIKGVNWFKGIRFDSSYFCPSGNVGNLCLFGIVIQVRFLDRPQELSAVSVE